MRMLLALAVSALPSLLVAEELDGFVTRDRLDDPGHPVLLQGAQVWEDTCQSCHGGNKLVGAPKITSNKAWAPRIARGLDALAANATEGFVGPTYKQMPARGGDPELSDEAVAAAVAFMVWASGGAAEAEAFADTYLKKEE